MSFSDKDLARFKESLSANVGVVFDIEDIEALLARLEAAEDFAGWAMDMNPNFEIVELAKAWRRAKGEL